MCTVCKTWHAYLKQILHQIKSYNVPHKINKFAILFNGGNEKRAKNVFKILLFKILLSFICTHFKLEYFSNLGKKHLFYF